MAYVNQLLIGHKQVYKSKYYKIYLLLFHHITMSCTSMWDQNVQMANTSILSCEKNLLLFTFCMKMSVEMNQKALHLEGNCDLTQFPRLSVSTCWWCNITIYPMSCFKLYKVDFSINEIDFLYRNKSHLTKFYAINEQ